MFTEGEIKRKRVEIHRNMTKNGVTSDLKGGKLNLRYLFELYDKIFFRGQIQRKLDQTNSKLDFAFSKHTKTGGTCSREGCEWKINIPIKLYQGLFSKGEKNIITNGIWCTSNLDCVQLTFEHELIHLLMQLYQYEGRKPEYSQSNDTFTSHGKLFQCMAFLYFGHTDYKHGLLGGEASNKLKKEDVHIGMNIKYFNTKYQKDIHGRVFKVNPKRAVVQHNDGKVFNVPYTMLELSDRDDTSLPEFAIKNQFRTGMRIIYFCDGKDYYGTIAKINPQSVIVLTDDGTKKSFTYQMLRKADNSPPKVIPEYEKKNVKDEIKVGDMVRVKWTRGGGISIRNGKIKKKNPSRAQILMNNDKKIWNVYYQNILGKVT